ncbi:MAG TPA: hypothetical protein VGR97_14795, partial [Candidatus Acidoferrales bacterium]|nr:hypothetical protein [Candidatus Acidoferrales bacterium]
MLRCIGLVVLMGLSCPALAAQSAPNALLPPPDAQKCASLANLSLQDAAGGPALITSARLVEVPASG